MAVERKFIQQNIKEFRIKQFIEERVSRVGLSDAKLKKTPLGDKIVIYASRPGLVVGRGGANIQELTRILKEKFNLDNPQIEIEEVPNPDLDADIVAERVVNSLERFGSGKTKGIGHRAMIDTINAGALGIEIIISGKIPSMRARSWRFYMGYLKKAGDIAVDGVNKAIKHVTLKSGAVGVKVRIMPPTLQLPDHIKLTEKLSTKIEEIEPEATEQVPETKMEEPPAEAPAKTERQAPEETPKKEQTKKPRKKAKKKPSETTEEKPAEKEEVPTVIEEPKVKPKKKHKKAAQKADKQPKAIEPEEEEDVSVSGTDDPGMEEEE